MSETAGINIGHPSVKRSWLGVFAGRGAKWIVLLVWIGITISSFGLSGALDAVLRDDPISYLPKRAESVAALHAAKNFPGGALIGANLVFHRANGLTTLDREKITAFQQQINQRLPPAVKLLDEPLYSENNTTALLIARIGSADSTEVTVKATTELRELAKNWLAQQTAADLLELKVAGQAGNRTDLEAVFDSIDGTLLLATAGLVLVLLLVIYRSPVFWLIPFVAAAVSIIVARGASYFLASSGFPINDQSANILPVLVFGAGTDYALLLVARYREELRFYPDHHDAMRTTLAGAGPAIIASGLTVIAALLTLLLAELNGISGLAAVGALGVFAAMFVMVSLLPALLLIFGRAAFFPFIPHYGSHGADETHGLWRKIGEVIARSPRPVWVITAFVLLLCCSGLFGLNTRLNRTNSYLNPDQIETVQGARLIAEGFPAGLNAPGFVIVPNAAQAEAVRAALKNAPAVAEVAAVELGAGASAGQARFEFALRGEPFSSEAFLQIENLRELAKQAGGDRVLIGGPTAEEIDVRRAAARDDRTVMPLALLVVFAVLALLLRALVAPLVLMATVVLSFAAALGASQLVFHNFFGFAGMDPSLPLIAFVFLVGLGVDYNIFLMTRVREEAESYGTRTGMTRGLAVTGSVITSAGLVLAGTFAALAALPLVLLIEAGFVITLGVLIDAFIVRSLLVPALTYDIGGRIWWPSGLADSVPDAQRERTASEQIDDFEPRVP